MESLRLTPRSAAERCRRLGGLIPPLEKDEACHLEFLRPPAHLVGKRAVEFAASPTRLFALLEAKMPFYRGYIVGLHDRPIGVVQLDCIDDESAIKSAATLADSHDVELWQMDRPVARLGARSRQVCKE
jgi:hypothetical protein